MVIITWMQLVHAIVNWHTNMCWRLILWTVNITTLPIRALSALRRQKMMGRLLQEMQYELENLAWDNKRLQAHLQMAVKEHHFMESMLSEIEEDHDKAIVKIELLEREVQRLREENRRLREVRSKGQWDSISKSSTEEDEQITEIPQQSIQNSNEKQPSIELNNPAGLVDPLTPLIFSSNIDIAEALDQRREVALSQSLFSAIFSLLVGLIIWAAEDPCFPLVMALFAVVFLSLRSVVQFFSTIRNRPASDAVALLSFNWFILGALACPTFPQLARLFSPVFGAFLGRIVS